MNQKKSRHTILLKGQAIKFKYTNRKSLADKLAIAEDKNHRILGAYIEKGTALAHIQARDSSNEILYVENGKLIRETSDSKRIVIMEVNSQKVHLDKRYSVRKTLD